MKSCFKHVDDGDFYGNALWLYHHGDAVPLLRKSKMKSHMFVWATDMKTCSWNRHLSEFVIRIDQGRGGWRHSWTTQDESSSICQ